MRKKNSIPEFSEQRSRLLLQNFRESLKRQSVISAKKAFSDAVNMPAPRFWVSEVRTLRIIRRMLNGDDPTVNMTEEKRKMYREILLRVRHLLDTEPSTPLGDIVFRVVNSEAPSYYMSPKTAKNILNPLRKSPFNHP